MARAEIDAFAQALAGDVRAGGRGDATLAAVRARYGNVHYRIANIRRVRERAHAVYDAPRAPRFTPARAERAAARAHSARALAAKQRAVVEIDAEAARMLLAQARRALAHPAKVDVLDTFAALALVTGRRATEIVRTGVFRAVKTPTSARAAATPRCVHHAHFTGQLKMRDVDIARHLRVTPAARDPRTDGFIIPLLAPCDEVTRGVARVRAFFGAHTRVSNADANARTHRFAARAAARVRRHAPFVRRFHDLRTVYAHFTFVLQPEGERAAMHAHLRDTLGHAFGRAALATGLHYANAWVGARAQLALAETCARARA